MKQKNTLRKIGRLLFYPFLLILFTSWFYADRISSWFAFLGESGNSVTDYLVHLDGWSLITGLIVLAASSVLLVLVELGIIQFTNKFLSHIKLLQRTWFSIARKLMALGLTLLILVLIANSLVIYSSKQYSTKDITQIQKSPVLVLGTSKMLSSGKGENIYFKRRIQAAKELWQAGKVETFILSGDKTTSQHYDETKDMKDDLVRLGIPASVIQIDTAGFRTLDSILRLKVLFQIDRATIITQDFHLQRALYLANHYGIKATGYVADGSAEIAMIKREFLSKPKLILDIYFANMMPRAGAVEYRKAFTMDNNAGLLTVIFLGISCFLVAGMLYKTLENNFKGIRKNIAFVALFLSLTVYMVFSIYENIEVKLVDKVVENVAIATGTKTGKMEAKEKVTAIQASIIQGREKAIIKETIITQEELAKEEITTPPPIRKSIAQPETSKKEVTNKSNLPERRSSIAIGSKNNRKTQQTHTNKTIQFFSAKVHGVGSLVNDQEIFIRNIQLIKDGKTIIPPNKVFKGRINLRDGKVYLSVNNVNGKPITLTAYDANKNEGISLTSFRKDKKENYFAPDGFPILLGL